MAERSTVVEVEIRRLHHDDETMTKVYHSIWKAMGIPEGPEASKADPEQLLLAKNIVSEMQNAGILFRERIGSNG